MSSKPKAGFDLAQLAAQLEGTRVKRSGDGPAFGGFDFDDLRTVFLTAIDWDESLSDYEQERIATKSIFEAASEGVLTKDSLLRALKKVESQRLSSPEQDYLVVFSLSVKYTAALRPVTVNGVRFRFHSKLPKTIERGLLHSATVSGHAVSQIEIPEAYVVACAHVTAKTPHNAHLRAHAAIEVLRSIWNYILHRGALRIWLNGSASWEPISTIRRGPTETLHLSNGKLVSPDWWCDPYYFAQNPANISNDWPKIQKSANKCLRWTNALPYADDMDIAWIRYVRALDDTGAEGCFLKLWSLLEYLTATKSATYEELIRRTLFTCRKRELHQLVLEHLRQRRNALVHLDDGTSAVTQHVFQLKRYVDELIRLHLVLRGRFRTMSEVGEFFSLPADPAMLQQRMKVFSQAVSFRKRTLVP